MLRGQFCLLRGGTLSGIGLGVQLQPTYSYTAIQPGSCQNGWDIRAIFEIAARTPMPLQRSRELLGAAYAERVRRERYR
jgi:hypothetical protein